MKPGLIARAHTRAEDHDERYSRSCRRDLSEERADTFRQHLDLFTRLIVVGDTASAGRSGKSGFSASLMRKTSPALPTAGYALVVDGHLKTEFKTKDVARSGAEELKRRFPMLQVKIYDASAKRSEEVV